MSQKKESIWVTIVYFIAAVLCGVIAVLSFTHNQRSGGIFSILLAIAMLCMAFVHFAVYRNQHKENK